MALKKKEKKRKRKSVRKVKNKEKSAKDETKKQKPKKTEVNFILLTIFVLGMLAVILIGVKVLSKPKVVSIEDLHEKNLEGKLDPEKGYVYNGFSFVYANGMWFTRVRKIEENMVYNIQLHFGPKQVQNVSVDGDIMQFREFNGTYITFDPLGADLTHVALAGSELSITLSTYFNMRIVSACTKNETNVCNIKDIVTCENNDQNPIVYIEESQETKIIQENNCIRIQGNGFGLTRAVDRLLYNWIGIM